MREYDKATLAASSAAWSATTVAFTLSTSAWAVSTDPWEIKFCANNCLARSNWRLASASDTLSLANCAAALATLASSLRASRVNSNCPALTNCPSLKCTLLMVLFIWVRTSTTLSGTTVPLALRVTLRSFFWAFTVVTDAGPPAGALAAALAGAAAGPAAPEAAVAGAVEAVSDLPEQPHINKGRAEHASTTLAR